MLQIARVVTVKLNGVVIGSLLKTQAERETWSFLIRPLFTKDLKFEIEVCRAKHVNLLTLNVLY